MAINSYVDGTVTLMACDWKELGFGVIGAETLLIDPGHDSVDILLEVFYISLVINRFEQEYIISVQGELCVLGQVYISD